MLKLISTLTTLPLLAAIFIGSLAAPCQAATPGTLAFPATLGGGDSLTVMDIILGHEDLSVFAALLDTANLDEVLIGAGPFTVFAPVNMAVDQLDPMLIISLVLDPASLAGVLGYHISESLLMSVDMTDGQSLGTLTDDELVLSVGDASIMVNNYATIVEADLVGSNGVVHVIDQVLFPEQSVDDLSAATFAAYPNPIQNELWIASTSGQTLQIHDATGRLIESINMPISGGRTLISTQDWAPGVMLISDDKGHVIRLVND
jgi:uncharacterized surface protein with fasciclin (FAS1) repeats